MSVAAREHPTSELDDPLSDDAITADFRVFQRIRGHRYSLDDVLTAWVAARRAPRARRVLDLGSGIGSVACMLAWKLEDARLTTIEAQAISLRLQLENLARNGLLERVTPIEGDFRDEARRAELGAGYDLVTGTPPYFPVGTALAPPDSQKAHARMELRGGVEAYLETAARCVAVDGAIVVCAAASRPERVTDTASALGLFVEEELVVSPRAGKPPLFTVWTLARGEAHLRDGRPHATRTFFARSLEGARSGAQREVRAFFGLEPSDEPASPPSRPRGRPRGRPSRGDRR